MDRHRGGTRNQEFENTREQVEWYFDTLVDDVAAESSVSRAELLETLVALQISANRRARYLLDVGDVAYRTADEAVIWLPEPVFDGQIETHDVTQAEARAARAVLRRMARAIVGVEHDPRPNTSAFVLLRYGPPSDPDTDGQTE